MTDKDSDSPDNSFTDSARQRAIEAYDSARDGVADAGRKAAGTLSEAPLIALAGVAAAGALIAALLPRPRPKPKYCGPPCAACARPPKRRSTRRARLAADG